MNTKANFWLTIISLYPMQMRCENILRTKPDSRIASELHLANIESQEQEDARK